MKNKIAKTIVELTTNRIQKAVFGCECSYISCGNNRGLKLYWNKKTRDYGFKHQKILSEKKISPKVGQKFDTLVDGVKIYGYITESVKTTNNWKYDKKLNNMKRRLKRAGYIWDDPSIYNIGFIKTKSGRKMVLIDTNPLAFKNKRKKK